MSIIYEALKKSQKTRSGVPPKKRLPTINLNMSKIARLRIPHLQRKEKVLLALIVTTLFMTLYLMVAPTPPASNLLFTQKALVLKPALASRMQAHLTLEGVFLSDNERLAMINHHTYREGDQINGMYVSSIALDRVTLKNKSHSVVLRNALTELD